MQTHFLLLTNDLPVPRVNLYAGVLVSDSMAALAVGSALRPSHRSWASG